MARLPTPRCATKPFAATLCSKMGQRRNNTPAKVYTYHLCATGPANPHTGVGTVTTLRRHTLLCAPLQMPRNDHAIRVSITHRALRSHRATPPVIQPWCLPNQCPQQTHIAHVHGGPQATQTTSPLHNTTHVCKYIQRHTAAHSPNNSTDIMLVHNGNIRCGRTGQAGPRTGSYPQQCGWPRLLSRPSHPCTKVRQGQLWYGSTSHTYGGYPQQCGWPC